LFGLVFIAAGALIVLTSLDVIHTDDADFHAPRELVAAFGMLFFLPGAWMVIHGLMGVARTRRLAAAAQRHLNAAWLYEHPWDRTGQRRSGWRRVGASLIGLTILSVFLAPFHWFLFFTAEDFPVFPQVIMGIFDLILLFIVADLLKRIVQALRYGTTYVRYEHFPYATGGTVRIALGVTRDPPRFDRLTVTLRAVEEVYETSGSGDNRSQKVVAYAVQQHESVVTHPHEMPTVQRDAWFEFDVERDAPGTDLASRPPKYWELAIHGDAPGVDFEDVFLVPIYNPL